MSHAEKCPVCEGKGRMCTLPFGYGTDATKKCHGCGGLGWITVEDRISYHYPTYPYQCPVFIYPEPEPRTVPEITWHQGACTISPGQAMC